MEVATEYCEVCDIPSMREVAVWNHKDAETHLDSIETGKCELDKSCSNMTSVFQFKADQVPIQLEDSTRSQVLTGTVHGVDHFSCIFSDDRMYELQLMFELNLRRNSRSKHRA